ncbi:hypothetical protein DT073_08250 [Microbacterium sp. ABRD28]|nr:hypothetical protein DT073_08250 [Microbacterium sp. ABRD28]
MIGGIVRPATVGERTLRAGRAVPTDLGGPPRTERRRPIAASLREAALTAGTATPDATAIVGARLVVRASAAVDLDVTEIEAPDLAETSTPVTRNVVPARRSPSGLPSRSFPRKSRPGRSTPPRAIS